VHHIYLDVVLLVEESEYPTRRLRGSGSSVAEQGLNSERAGGGQAGGGRPCRRCHHKSVPPLAPPLSPSVHAELRTPSKRSHPAGFWQARSPAPRPCPRNPYIAARGTTPSPSAATEGSQLTAMLRKWITGMQGNALDAFDALPAFWGGRGLKLTGMHVFSGIPQIELGRITSS